MSRLPSDIAIRVEHLSKMYRLGSIGTGTISHDLNVWWHRMRGQENPYTRIGEENKREQTGSSNYVWALQDINFEVKKGEILGIIGKNGAGKSTLLKILSRITGPTKGKISVNGRMASLLEVGTGFHPELTGRENIFLNGAILGMTKREIRAKFDEIVEFSGCARYVDTPVKRYSSGMTVRLGFAVAAFLEPEILVVDEVLAVGDADFQKKCLGKMKDVSTQDGRTVLFVSHNMTAVKSLCQKGILMQSGKLVYADNAENTVNEYLKKEALKLFEQQYSTPEKAPGNDQVRLKQCAVVPQYKDDVEDIIEVATPVDIEFDFWWMSEPAKLSLSLHLYNLEGNMIFNIHTPVIFTEKKEIRSVCRIPGKLLNDGSYYISMMVVKDGTTPIYNFEECLHFTIEDQRIGYDWHGKWPGMVRPTFIPFNFTEI